MLRWLRADPDLCSQTAGTADLIRVLRCGGKRHRLRVAGIYGQRTDRRSPPIWTYRRANTLCPSEFGRASTFLPVAPFRKARVVAPACKRRCPRFFTSGEKPRDD